MQNWISSVLPAACWARTPHTSLDICICLLNYIIIDLFRDENSESFWRLKGMSRYKVGGCEAKTSMWIKLCNKLIRRAVY